MYKGKSFLAVIPARSGSKRLPGKNIRLLAGKPLLAYSINASIQTDYIDFTMVSTDSQEIAELSVKNNASVPFIRPAELATDEASTVDVALHAINELENTGKEFDYLVILQPTSPLRTGNDIKEAIEEITDSGKDALISVCKTEHPGQWQNSLPPDLSMDNFIPEKYRVRSQLLEPYYRINGALYIIKIPVLKSLKTFFPGKGTMAYIMDTERSVDIDNERDFRFAEFILKGK